MKMNQKQFTEMLINKKKPYLRGQGPLNGMMFVGTNPSVRSKLENLWSDPYGKYFGNFLIEAGINPYGIYITNLYKHPTSDNRPLVINEIREGWNELLIEIGFVNPNIIICLGKQVQNQFNVKVNKLKNWRTYRVYGLHHPSYINRNQSLKVEYINQLIKIKQLYDNRKKII